ncbi:flagellar export chaperone FlgN [Chromobacterium amazonense]|uniref:flagellar export chaperone FlgN n=1 Tax=Chromobacterium amazonense TaxID=1382803 RepID=UPI0031F6DCAC
MEVVRKNMLKAMVESLDKDIVAYDAFKVLLQNQLVAMQQRDAEMLENVGMEIIELVTLLQNRNEKRVALLGAFSGGKSNISLENYIESLDERVKEVFQQKIKILHEKVNDCRQLNSRNVHVSTVQYELLQIRLNGERHTYV